VGVSTFDIQVSELQFSMIHLLELAQEKKLRHGPYFKKNHQEFKQQIENSDRIKGI
jgi:hypothetical protein